MDQFNESAIRQYLKTKTLGHTLYFYPSIDSTSIVAKELAEKGAPHGTLVIAEIQTRGRGRLGRTWFSPQGGLWFSLLLRPQNPPIMPAHITFVSGLSIAQAVAKLGISVHLKWPNDIYLDEKKIGGILSETKSTGPSFEYLIIGIGLNVNIPESDFPSTLAQEATSLLTVKEKPVSRALLLGAILLALEKLLELYPKVGFSAILKAWKKYAAFLGTQVRVDTSKESFEGEAIDVTLSGALRVQDIDGLVHEISTGDVRKLNTVTGQ